MCLTGGLSMLIVACGSGGGDTAVESSPELLAAQTGVTAPIARPDTTAQIQHPTPVGLSIISALGLPAVTPTDAAAAAQAVATQAVAAQAALPSEVASTSTQPAPESASTRPDTEVAEADTLAVNNADAEVPPVSPFELLPDSDLDALAEAVTDADWQLLHAADNEGDGDDAAVTAPGTAEADPDMTLGAALPTLPGSESDAETAADTTSDTPDDTPAETANETPAEATEESPTDTPIESPVEPAAALPIELPAPPAATDATPIEATETISPAPAERSVTIGLSAGDVEKILDRVPVSTSQLNVQQTPVDTEHGYVYTANIEPGPRGDVDDIGLYTVLRQGTQDSDGNWNWTSVVVDDRTVHDEWHTAPSVAADRHGDLHVVYNMHNVPWQYQRSDQPHDIESLQFKGQYLSMEDIQRWKYENKTSFPTLGTGAIPGNQITYPRFQKDNDRDLYLTYRFAAKPARSFPERTMSGGVARFSVDSQQWLSIGGRVATEEGDFSAHADAPEYPVAMAADTGWTVYHPRLMFGPSNELSMQLYFRQGIAGAEQSRPCYVRSSNGTDFFHPDGSYASMPLTADVCGNMGYADSQEFYTIGSTAMDSTGKPYILLSPIGNSRTIASLDDSGNWTYEDSPYAATELFVDAHDNLWAIARGINLLKRSPGSSDWELVYSDSSADNCYPRASLNADKNIAYIHTHACDLQSISIHAVRLID